LTNTYVSCLAVLVYVILYAWGVFTRTLVDDAGGMWIPINEGLPEDPTAQVLARGPDISLILGTDQMGLYRNIDPVSVNDHITIPSNEIQLWTGANPFSRKFLFEIELTRGQNLSIGISDPAGQHIVNIHKGFTESGKHSFQWEPIDAHPQGLYFLNITGESNKINRKILYVK